MKNTLTARNNHMASEKLPYQEISPQKMHHTNIVLRMVGTTINTIGVRIEFEYDYLHSFGFICTCTIARV